MIYHSKIIRRLKELEAFTPSSKARDAIRNQEYRVTVAADAKPSSDAINPSHYRGHPSGVECIQITEHMNFTLGNAVKYIWRAAMKGQQIEDLKKARWYLDREIARLEREPRS